MSSVSKLFLLVCILAILLAFQVSAQVIVVEEVIVEQHSGDQPRVSGPSLTKMPNGALLAAFSYISMKNESLSGIWGKISNDNGETWGGRFLIKGSAATYEAFPSACLTNGERTFIFYDRWVAFGESYRNCTVWKLESTDNGRTWGNERRIDTGAHEYTLASYNAISMRDGTLVCPISWVWKYEQNTYSWRSSILRSIDEGKTWTEGAQIPDYSPSVGGLDEPAVVELTSGSLLCILRTEIRGVGGHHVASTSDNCGQSWTTCHPLGEMRSCSTSPAVFRYSWDPNIVVAAWINRTLEGYASFVLDRCPLVASVSLDDGVTWGPARIVDDSANRSMNEMCLVVSNGNHVIIGYRRYADVVEKGVDVNGDGVVNILDAIIMSSAFGHSAESPDYNVNADLNSDNVVDLYDAILFSTSAWIPPPLNDDAVTRRFEISFLLGN